MARRGRARLILLAVVGVVVVAAGAGYAEARFTEQPAETVVRLQPSPSPASPVPTATGPLDLWARVSAKGVRQCGLGFADARLWTVRQTGTSFESYGPVLAVGDRVITAGTGFCGFWLHFFVRPGEPAAFMVVENDPTDSSVASRIWGPFGMDKALLDGVFPLHLRVPQ